MVHLGAGLHHVHPHIGVLYTFHQAQVSILGYKSTADGDGVDKIMHLGVLLHESDLVHRLSCLAASGGCDSEERIDTSDTDPLFLKKAILLLYPL